VVLATCCLLTAASAQWVETVIDLGARVSQVCYNSVNNKAYCVVSGVGLVVISGANNEVIDSIALDQPVLLSYNARHNKVYCWLRSRDLVVLDGETDSVVTIVALDHDPCGMFCSETYDKVYCGSDCICNTTSVIDCAADTVLATFYGAAYFSLSQVQHKVYCTSFWPTVLVLDARSDTVVAEVDVGADLCGGVYVCDREEKVYCPCSDSTVRVVDGRSDTVTDLPPICWTVC